MHHCNGPKIQKKFYLLKKIQKKFCYVFGGHSGKKGIKTFDSVRHPNQIIEQFF